MPTVSLHLTRLPTLLLRGLAWHEVTKAEVGDDEARALLWLHGW
jgi:hypothetical protein